MAERLHARGARIRQPMISSRPPRVGDHNLVVAASAILLGLLLLTSGLGTWGQWSDRSQQSVDPITAGSVSLSGTLEVQLLSRQLPGRRTYASPTACSFTTPYVECRIVTATLANERLIPGDTLRIVRGVTLAGQGDNLKGNLRLDAASLLDQGAGASDFAKSAAVSMAVTKPDASAATVSGLISTIPVARGQAATFGTYTAVATVATPPTKTGSGAWNTELQGQTLDLGALTARFTQTS